MIRHQLGLLGDVQPGLLGEPLTEDDFARCVHHAYHVLMARASRATVLYSTDEETRTSRG
ncbi:hypothetical protein [Streptomyces mirabilis]